MDAFIITYFDVERIQKISHNENMSDLKQQILKELSSLEEKVSHLQGAASNAGKQTDLEVAILSKQVDALREKNARADDFIGKAISVLKSLK